MRQSTFAVAGGFEQYGRARRRSEFLASLEVVVPWTDLIALIEPHYPKAGNGRPPVGWSGCCGFTFSSSGLICPIQRWRMRCTIRSQCAASWASIWVEVPVLDETTVCKFRHLLEHHELGRPMLAEANRYLARHGLKVGTGTNVDATILGAPSSTKNKSGERDPEMHSTKKNGQWFFGMKAHMGVDAETKLIHSVEATAANVHDSKTMSDLLHGSETGVWGDQAYQGHPERIRQRAPNAVDRTNQRSKTKLGERVDIREANRLKSKIRARVEHVFGTMKLRFGFSRCASAGLPRT